MKKKITIYLVGVLLAWYMTFNVIAINRSKPTYGHIALVTFVSLFSWMSVVASGVVYISELEFWDKPI